MTVAAVEPIFWIDGQLRRIDDESHMQRFTLEPVNVALVEELEAAVKTVIGGGSPGSITRTSMAAPLDVALSRMRAATSAC